MGRGGGGGGCSVWGVRFNKEEDLLYWFKVFKKVATHSEEINILNCEGGFLKPPLYLQLHKICASGYEIPFCLHQSCFSCPAPPSGLA